jgi:bifunctional UDP-N-acetylglucosamine pyrophosphorylase/glucosamine-1-phosphate N-acetyltransferase
MRPGVRKMSGAETETAGPQVRAAAVVLAAGEGKRLHSKLPKVLHPAAGRPLLVHALAALEPLSLTKRIVVASKRKEELEKAVGDAGLSSDFSFVVQDPPRGTGDALRVALRELPDGTEVVLVTQGDSPGIIPETLQGMLAAHVAAHAAATILTTEPPDPYGLGRVVRSPEGDVKRVVEEGDASEEERAIGEVNAGFYVFDAPRLAAAVEGLKDSNSQGELYLTDIVELLTDEGATIVAHRGDWREAAGVNTRLQLAEVAATLRLRAAVRWMEEGVTIVDPASTFIDATVVIGRDATIHPFTFLEGNTQIEEGAEVGPQVKIIDSTIGPGASVSFAVVRGAEIGPEASVGPFASVRPGTKLARGAKLGTFVESKNTTLGADSKANHLAYLGDAEVGTGVNIGAGTITCNWDGQEKHKTIIEDDAYIASDTMLVAPLRVGKRAATGAGSVVRDDVPDDALAVGVPARVIEGGGDKMHRKDEAKETNEEAEG